MNPARPTIRGIHDARTVVLPHGTEVTLGIDVHIGERRIPQGSLARVVRTTGDDVEIRVVGVGSARVPRDALVPRHAEQLPSLQRRADLLAQLTPCIVLETVVGSTAWGLSELHSDTDRRGVFALPFSWSSGVALVPEDLVSADGSSSYWVLEKCVRQALRADPNTLEMLFVPGASASDELGQMLIDVRDAFVSSRIYGSFGRYATPAICSSRTGSARVAVRTP